LKYITKTSELLQLLDRLSDQKYIAYDSEFIRERTFYPELCLIQLATKEEIAVIDCKAEVQLDLLFKFLENFSGEVVMHGCLQDLEILGLYDCLPLKVCDTQIASSLIGFKPQIGLQSLCSDLLNIDLPKTLSRSNWLKRPLAEDEIKYAADDVRHLILLFEILKDKLDELNRISWFQDDCEALKKEAGGNYCIKFLYRVMHSNKKLLVDPNYLLTLIEWREIKAKSLNKPRQWILADRYIKKIAYDRNFSIKDLPFKSEQSIVEINEALSSYETKEIKIVSNKGRSDPEEISFFYKSLAEKGLELNLNKEVISSKVEVNSYLRREPLVRYGSAWRKAIIKDIQDSFNDPSRS
jgi:ribonuclease D